jgi:hypothetical protein
MNKQEFPALSKVGYALFTMKYCYPQKKLLLQFIFNLPASKGIV